MTASIAFTVEGMNCASCGLLVDETVEELDGVERCQTDVRRRRSTVAFDPAVVTATEITAAIAEAGYRAQPLSSGS